MNVLGFTPLFDPLPALAPGMDNYWLWLVVPLVVAIAIVYKGTRVKQLRSLPWDATRLSLEIIGGMIFAAAAVWGLYWAAVRVF